MAVFSSTRNGDSERSAAPAGPHHLSILAPGAKLVGHLETESVVKIEGRLEGSVRAADQVLVTTGGVVEGDVIGREVVIGGEVKGNVQAFERVEVLAGGLIEGDLTTPRVAVQEGGRVNGRVTMADPSHLDHRDRILEESAVRSTPLLQSA
jgi:cytoskeletal protein CcmA (bactofilin family)